MDNPYQTPVMQSDKTSRSPYWIIAIGCLAFAGCCFLLMDLGIWGAFNPKPTAAPLDPIEFDRTIRYALIPGYVGSCFLAVGTLLLLIADRFRRSSTKRPSKGWYKWIGIACLWFSGLCIHLTIMYLIGAVDPRLPDPTDLEHAIRLSIFPLTIALVYGGIGVFLLFKSRSCPDELSLQPK